MVARILIVSAFLAVPAFFMIRVLFDHLDTRAKLKRMDKYVEWSRTVPEMPEPERAAAMALMMQVMRDTPNSEYRGPWEKL